MPNPFDSKCRALLKSSDDKKSAAPPRRMPQLRPERGINTYPYLVSREKASSTAVGGRITSASKTASSSSSGLVGPITPRLAGAGLKFTGCGGKRGGLEPFDVVARAELAIGGKFQPKIDMRRAIGQHFGQVPYSAGESGAAVGLQSDRQNGLIVQQRRCQWQTCRDVP